LASNDIYKTLLPWRWNCCIRFVPLPHSNLHQLHTTTYNFLHKIITLSKSSHCNYIITTAGLITVTMGYDRYYEKIYLEEYEYTKYVPCTCDGRGLIRVTSRDYIRHRPCKGTGYVKIAETTEKKKYYYR
jgi:hypothetical protein